MTSLRCLLFLGLLLCQLAQAQEPIALVGTLSDDVAALFSVASDQSRAHLDAAILIRRSADSSREIPDASHPDGGALLWSHSVYYEDATRTVWIDGHLLLCLEDANVVMLVEAQQSGKSPTVAGTELADRGIGSGPTTIAGLREFLMRQDAVREFVGAAH